MTWSTRCEEVYDKFPLLYEFAILRCLIVFMLECRSMISDNRGVITIAT